MESLICHHSSFEIVARVDELPIKQCNSCSLVYRDLKEIDKKPTELYKKYYSDNNTSSRFSAPLELVVKIFRRLRAHEVKKQNQILKVLDIGCGRGWMLWFLKNKFGADVAGTQIAEPAARFAREKLKINVVTADLLDKPFTNTKFTVVTMWHVLEHVPYPEAYINEISRLLEPGGILIIEVPNWNSWTRRLVGEYWLGYDVKHHINFFTLRSLQTMFIKNNMEIQSKKSFSLEYSVFLSVSSLVSYITRKHHYFFETLQGNNKLSPVIVIDIILFVLFLIPAFIVNLAFYKTNLGEVLHLVIKKK